MMMNDDDDDGEVDEAQMAENREMAAEWYFIFLVAIFVRPVPSNRFENFFFPLTQSSAHEMEPQSTITERIERPQNVGVTNTTSNNCNPPYC